MENGQDFKAHLHQRIRWVREALVWKLDGCSEYDIRRPLTSTGTNLLGLVKHCAVSESRYLGLVFDRPFREPLPAWDDDSASESDSFAAATESRADILGLYRRVWAHSDATVQSLELSSMGYVPWWDDTVTLFEAMAHVLGGASRHAGHADILREGLDGSVGLQRGVPARHGHDETYWTTHCDRVEAAARAAAATTPAGDRV